MLKKHILWITVVSLINLEYRDYFLELIELTSENDNTVNLAIEVSSCLDKYGLNLDNIVSCSTDNCSVMNATADELNLWRLHCTCHLLNLIFEEFAMNCKSELDTFLDLNLIC